MCCPRAIPGQLPRGPSGCVPACRHGSPIPRGSGSVGVVVAGRLFPGGGDGNGQPRGRRDVSWAQVLSRGPTRAMLLPLGDRKAQPDGESFALSRKGDDSGHRTWLLDGEKAQKRTM